MSFSGIWVQEEIFVIFQNTYIESCEDLQEDFMALPES